MKNLLLLFFFFATCLGAMAQIAAADADYRDTTSYRAIIPSEADTTHYTPFSHKQDSIFVYFERHAKQLSCTVPKGEVAYFHWQKLDTASFTFNTFWIDTVSVIDTLVSPTFSQLAHDSSKCYLPKYDTTYVTNRDTSGFVDSMGMDNGYYRVLIDALQPIYDTIECSEFCIEMWNGEGFDTIFVDTVLYVPKAYEIVAADTFAAWIFVDTFRVDTIEVLSHDCNWLNIQAVFYPAGINEGYYNYKYFDAWHAPRKINRNYPDCLDCYIKNVEWEPSRDIHEGASVADDGEWKNSYFSYIPKPLHDATYTVMVENYFGKIDTLPSDTILAKAIVVQLKLFSEGEDGEWIESTGGGEEYPATIKVANASINGKLGSTFTWSLYDNVYDYAEDVSLLDLPLMYPQVTTFDSAENVQPESSYMPGKYPITLHVINQFECEGTDTTYLEVDEFLINKEAIPKAFTPNGDGLNDIFMLKDPESNVRSLKEIDIHIFNRYGQLMFRSSDVLFGWEGKVLRTNASAPDGVYFYKIKARGFDKRHKLVKQTLSGYIHLFNGK
ncbi:MAG: gliding motility-associated C-terminal domain-containing protein [Bacteroidales bacterium]